MIERPGGLSSAFIAACGKPKQKIVGACAREVAGVDGAAGDGIRSAVRASDYGERALIAVAGSLRRGTRVLGANRPLLTEPCRRTGASKRAEAALTQHSDPD